jgi:23S rRNA (uracil1939-C5)-methyltransferase
MTILDISRFAHDLRGVAHSDGMTWFVEGALPGEQVSASILSRRSQMIDAVADNVVDHVSLNRINPQCEYFGRCGGCALQHVDPASQVTVKQQVLLEQLQRLGRVVPKSVLQPIFSDPWAYRRRVRFACKWSSDKKHLMFGLRERHNEKIVEIAHCDVMVKPLQVLIEPLRRCLSGWSQPRQLGHVEALAADNGVAVLLRLMSPPSLNDAELLHNFFRETGASVYLQVGSSQFDEAADAVFFCGGESLMRYSHASSQTQIDCVPGDFVQGNASVNLLLIDAVLEALQVDSDDDVLEAFSGLGNFTLPLARRVKHISALEVSKPMLVRANKQASSQSFTNIQWHVSNLDHFSSHKLHLPRSNKILLDPPREGAQDFCKSVSLKDVSRLVYVSCNPSTLARDAAILAGRGWMLDNVRYVDMFPQTHHIEALAVFVPDASLKDRKSTSKKPVIKNSERRLRR